MPAICKLHFLCIKTHFKVKVLVPSFASENTENQKHKESERKSLILRFLFFTWIKHVIWGCGPYLGIVRLKVRILHPNLAIIWLEGWRVLDSSYCSPPPTHGWEQIHFPWLLVILMAHLWPRHHFPEKTKI